MKPLDFETMTAAIEEQNRKQPYSGVISVFHRGNPVFHHAYGLANRSEKTPNRLNTRFGMASGGKIFTAAAIGLLVEAEELRFDQPVIEFLREEMPQLSDQVLVRHLLSHTSGLPDYFDESVMGDYEALWRDKPVYRMLSAHDFLPLMADQPMQFEPGTRFAYNNGAFVLAGLLVEKVSGQVFQQFVEEKIFGPAWMRASGYFRTDRLPQHTALGYITEEENWRSNIFSVPVIGHGDGGAYTTTADMKRFWAAFWGKRFFKEDILNEMLTPQIKASEDEVFHYGLGCWMNDLVNSRFYYVMGEDPGVEFYSGYYPDFDLQITLTANQNGPLWDMVKVIREGLFFKKA